MGRKLYEYTLKLFLFLWCSGTLFLNSSSFVNAQVDPQKYCFLFLGIALILLSTVSSYFVKEIQPKNLTCFICAIITIICSIEAVYAILQYAGILRAFEGHRMIGSFDNPAGLAACLCAGLPFMLYKTKDRYAWQKYISIAAIALVSVTVILSGSRAGMLSLFVVVAAVFFSKK